MIKALKITGAVFLVLLLIALAVYFYIFREQSIAVHTIPKELRVCDRSISADNEEYLNLVSWLKENDEGWRLTYARLIAEQTYYSSAFSVILVAGGVVVAYKTDDGFPRFVKAVDAHGLNFACDQVGDWQI